MRTVNNVCGKCGAKIPDDTTREVCPACLLETGLGLLPDDAVAGIDDPGHSAGVVKHFGDFEIARRGDGSLWELGRGGMGVTYLAVDNVLRRKVALKVIDVPVAARTSHTVRERFLREARAAAALRHPNVAAVYHFGTVPAPDRCYYAMELVEGETLEARVRREGPLKVAQVLEIGAQVTRALIAAANQGLIHRDLKPGNVMLTRSEESSAGFEVKVIDFGLAKVTAESFGEMDLTHGGFVGTPSYASPEQFAGGRVDARSDIYSLGASLWFALTGHLPCAGANVEEIRRCQTEAPLPVQQLVARKVPAPVIALLRSTLAVDPEERPASARELMEAIEECRSKLTGGGETTRRSFFAELQRRNVYKVAVAYAVVAWLLMQVASQIFPFFEIPNWTIRLVIMLLALGFPVALVLAWAFELTPEGIKRTEEVDLSKSIRRKTGRKLDFLIIAVLLLVIAALLFQLFHSKVSPAISSSPEKSIAVLPFVNMSPDKENEYLSDGITEDLSIALSQIRDLHVPARTSSFAFKGRTEDIRKIGQQLNVATVLEGSVSKAGNKLRVSAQLSSVADGFHLWAATYDRDMTDILEIRSDISRRVVDALKIQLGVDEMQRVIKKPTENLKAYEAYLLGRFELNKFTEKGFTSSVQNFQQAIALDPEFALAHAGLAEANNMLGYWNYLPPKDAFPEAKRAAVRALELDPVLAEAHTALAFVQYEYDWRFEEADAEFKEAIRLKPGSASAHLWFAEFLTQMGRFQEAEKELERARELDPLSVRIRFGFAAMFFYKRQFDRALDELQKVIIMDPNNSLAFDLLSGVFGHKKMPDQSFEAAEKANSLEGLFSSEETAEMRKVYETAGQSAYYQKTNEFLRKQRANGKYRSPLTIALHYAIAGADSEALDWLEKAVDERAPWVPELKMDPTWDGLRSQPRFEALVQKVFAPKNTEAESAKQVPRSSESLAKSIAVLPFENLSRDPDNAYFAQGIQEEILTRLTSIADLRVISRTSTQQYQSKPPNLAEIARQLGVANIVEGSVQKVADQVRVNVQLVNAQSDSHLWAETYDRKLTDIFGVESEIAKRVAESLQAKLTGREEQALAVKPTNNPEAYDAYLRGLDFEARSRVSLDLRLKAIDSYERAVQLDSNFVAAWARLSRAHAILYFLGGDTTAARREATKRALESAQKLQPNSPETLVALGYYQYLVLRDYGPAKTTFSRVSKMLPGNSEVPEALGYIARREGNWDESNAYLEQALALDPRNPELLEVSASTFAMLRQFPAALKLYDRVLDIIPNDPESMLSKAGIYQAEGNLQQAAKFLSEINAQNPLEIAFLVKLTQLRLERNHGDAIRLLQTRLAQFHFASEIPKGFVQLSLAFTQHLAGDSAGAKVTAKQARNTLEPFFKNQPDNSNLATGLSQAYAVLGEKDSALKTAERAIVLLPSAKDRVDGPALEENLALIQTIFGENSSAISTLTHLLQTPYNTFLYGTPVTPALLRLDPIWDPLRADPAFQKLCEEKQPIAPESMAQSAPAKSIAVLPFENLSRDPDNAYFADGIQEEILTRLAKIADLKVISRTSTQQYQSKPGNLSEIAKQLGVANILEGTVQKAGDQVRVNVQLVDAQTDSHLWAETYDRKLTDIFGVESEIAKGVAESLQAKLTGREEQELAVKPTNNPEAYDAYLRGLAFGARSTYSEDAARKTISFYERAAQLDPNFALAWARLSGAHAFVYFNRFDTTAARRDAAKRALENAQKLAPNSPETVLALGHYQYWVLRDYGLAKSTFALVSKMLPGSSEVPKALGYIARREGHWDQSIASFEQALALDPRNTELLLESAATYSMLRQFPAALKLYDRALDIMPDNLDVIQSKAGIYQAQGNLQEAAKLLSEVNAQTPSWFALTTKITQLRLERNLGEAIRLLQARQTQFRFASESDKVVTQVHLVVMQRLNGDTAGAKVTAAQARNMLEPLCKNQPDNAALVAALSVANAGLGDKEAALKEAERAIMLLPSSKDRVDGPACEENLAKIQTMVGENSRAISTLTRLLQTPYSGWLYWQPVTPGLLRLDPLWDPLRGDPAFQKLCEEKKEH
jgi:TolB-like protein/Tfp pilus assembly protein PilF